MFKGIIDALNRIANLMQVRNSLDEAILAELCSRRERDGRRNRKANKSDAATYAAGLAGSNNGSYSPPGTATEKQGAQI